MSSAAFFSDVHGNLEALRAVLDDVDRRGYDEIFCLGDIVGYGPDPGRCLSLVQQRCTAAILGNHDYAVLHEPLRFNKVARESVEWTKKQLRPLFDPEGVRKHWEFLARLPPSYQWRDMLLVHGSPRDPTNEYILPKYVEWPPLGMFEEIFSAFDKVCLVGHTHIPGIFEESYDDFVTYLTPDFPLNLGKVPRFIPEKEAPKFFKYERKKIIINVGSVGQPRNDDWRACYVGLDDGHFTFHRVEYPVEITKRKILAIPGLDDSLAERLGGVASAGCQEREATAPCSE